MKLISFLLALVLATGPVLAQDTPMVLPAGPGSTLDLVGRTVAEGYKKVIGRELVPENRPGADQLIGFSAFQKNENSVLVGGLVLHAFNYYFRNEPPPHTPEDFYNVTVIGWQPQIWYASAESGIRTPRDLKEKLSKSSKGFIAGDTVLGFVNAGAFLNRYDKDRKIKTVRHKTSTEAATAVAGGFLDVGIGTLTPTVVSLVKQKKLFVIGSSAESTITMDGITIPSISASLGIPQFNGGYVISLNPKSSKDRKEQMSRDIFSALQDPETKEKLEKLGLIYLASDRSSTEKILKDLRSTVGRYKPIQ